MSVRFLLLVSLSILVGTFALAQPKPDLPILKPENAKFLRASEALPAPVVGCTVLDGKGVLVGCENGTLRYWPIEAGKDLLGDTSKGQTLQHPGTLTALCSRGGRVATASSDGKVLLWELPATQPVRTIETKTSVRALDISFDGTSLATAGTDGTVELWSLPQSTSTGKLTGPADWLGAVAFSPDGKLVAAGGDDGKLWVWEIAGSKKRFDVLAQPPAPPKGPAPVRNVVSALAFSPDGKSLSLGGSDGKIYQFASDTGKLIRTLQGHTGVITALVYHPAGVVLISASKDRTVRLWNAASGTPIKTLEGHTAWVQNLCLAAQGSLAASASADRTVRLWDLGAVPAPLKKK